MLSSGQQQSSASLPPPPLPRLIWFLLVDSETGEPYKNCSVSSILHSLLAVPVIDQFRDAVYAKNSSILPGIAPVQLVVYKNKAAFDRRNNAEDKGKEQPLDPTESIGVLGSKEDMLVVAVPDLSLIKEPSRESKRAKQSAFWFLLVDSETGELYKGAGIDAVSLSPHANIIQFRDAVHAKNSNKLGGIGASDLLVYKNKAAFDARNDAEDDGKEQPLKASRILDGLGESEEEALIVAVPSPRNEILVSNKKTKKTTSYRFLLLDSATGQPFKGTTADFVSLPSGADVAEFRKLVHLQNSSILTGIAPAQLVVYKNKAAFNARNHAEPDGKEQPLDPNESIGVLGSKKDMLVVAVPPPIQTPSFYPSPDPFFNIIPNVTEADEWISFGEECIPLISLNRLYIRECYVKIASSILQVSGIHKAIIFGTPGIGKSLFLIYLLWRLVKERKRVLFLYGSCPIYYDGNGGVFQCSSDRLPLDDDYSFWNDTLWCLFDAKDKKDFHLMQLPSHRSTFIVSTSPRREMVNDFKKPPSPQVFYMPIWTEDELETIAPLFPEAKDIWRERFTILGGIPRFVLEETKETTTEILEEACNDCSLDDCIKKIGINSSITERSKVIHSLIHMTSTDPFTKPIVQYASAKAMDIIVHKHNLQDKHKMRRLLASCEGNPLTAALRGYIFEQHAIQLLEKGGSFPCRKLVGGNSRTPPRVKPLVIPSSTKIIVDKVSTEQPPKQLHVPKTKNYAGIDAWIPGIGAFQMTVSKKHDINERTRGDLAKLGAKSKFYFALPPSIYSSFTKQKPQDIDQYAILILYPE